MSFWSKAIAASFAVVAAFWVGFSFASSSSSDSRDAVYSSSGSEPVAGDSLIVAAAPAKYAICKACHGPQAKGGPLAPDLTASVWTLDQWIKQVKNGSNWAGRPPKAKGYETKIMIKQVLTDDEVKTIFDWVKAGAKS